MQKKVKKSSNNQIKLDKVDYKIMHLLEFDGRAPVSSIAKILKKSTASVIYRINRLTNQKIIVGTYPIVNMGKLGYKNIKMYINFEKLDPAREKEIVSFFLRHECVGIIVLLQGCYDMQVNFLVKDMHKMYELVNELSLKFGDNIAGKQFAVIVENNFLKKNYLYNMESSEKITISYEEENEKMEDTDKKIINILSKNGRASLLSMAKELKISVNAVKYRKKRLESAGIIAGYMAYYNFKKLDYQRHKVFLRVSTMEKKEFNSLVTFLSLEPNVIYLSKVISSNDLEFDTDFRNTNEFNEFINKLKERFPDKIKKIDSAVIRGEYLSGYHIFHEGLIPNL